MTWLWLAVFALAIYLMWSGDSDRHFSDMRQLAGAGLIFALFVVAVETDLLA